MTIISRPVFRRGRPFVLLQTYAELCAVCIANAHHKCGSSRKGLTFMCNTCMNDWSEYCDDKQDHGASLSMNVWQEWFRDFRDLALRNLETAQ